MERDRLTTAPVGELLTFTRDIGPYECENFILDSAIAKYNGFPNWVAHIRHVDIALSGQTDFYSMKDNFQNIQKIVYTGLRAEGYEEQAVILSAIDNEDDFNTELIRQYTQNGLYHDVNRLLRLGHSGSDIGNHNLVPWILQLNAAIWRLPEVGGDVFRGTTMNKDDLMKYKKGQIFVWSSFVSYSKNQEQCFGGNVIFRMRGVSGIAEWDKRAPRDIAAFSVFPEEQEVIMPICGAYRVNRVDISDGMMMVDCDILDHNQQAFQKGNQQDTLMDLLEED